MKTITTGTKITFKETGNKFKLTKKENGFDVQEIKLSKNVPSEPYTFQEFLDMYEAGQISIEGFEDIDSGLVHSIITNYIYEANLEILKSENETLKSENETLKSENETLKKKIEELTTENAALIEAGKI